MKKFSFNQLEKADLIIDAIYEGGTTGTAGDDPINKLLAVGISGGFRFRGSFNKRNMNYLVLYTSSEDLNWPDEFDYENGVFKYYGDNKTPGKELHDTKKRGNEILKWMFDNLHLGNNRTQIPPVFVFKKYPTNVSNRSVQFKGLCVPGREDRNSSDDLMAIWRTENESRFQNYVAYFSMLNIVRVKRDWLDDLLNGIKYSSNTPKEFSNWIKGNTVKILKSEKNLKIRTKENQLPTYKEHEELLKYIYEVFKENPYDFEYFAAKIFEMFNQKISIDEVTKKTSDGGYDATGKLNIGISSDPVKIEFILEAKCFNINNGLGVKQTSRLIARLRHKFFGVLVTTSYVNNQAYNEIREDNHPIIILAGYDIINILLENGYKNRISIDKLITKIKHQH